MTTFKLPQTQNLHRRKEPLPSSPFGALPDALTLTHARTPPLPQFTGGISTAPTVSSWGAAEGDAARGRTRPSRWAPASRQGCGTTEPLPKSYERAWDGGEPHDSGRRENAPCSAAAASGLGRPARPPQPAPVLGPRPEPRQPRAACGAAPPPPVGPRTGGRCGGRSRCGGSGTRGGGWGRSVPPRVGAPGAGRSRRGWRRSGPRCAGQGWAAGAGGTCGTCWAEPGGLGVLPAVVLSQLRAEPARLWYRGVALRTRFPAVSEGDAGEVKIIFTFVSTLRLK